MPDIILCSLGKRCIDCHLADINWALFKRFENTLSGEKRAVPYGVVKGSYWIRYKEAIVFNGQKLSATYAMLIFFTDTWIFDVLNNAKVGCLGYGINDIYRNSMSLGMYYQETT